MGAVDFDFKPSVPIFDANVALGRRHDRRVSEDTAEGTVSAMVKAGIDRALVYSPHAVNYDTRDGNRLLLETIQGHDGLIPQFVCNPAFDDIDVFSAEIEEHNVRAVRIFPALHKYPLRDWILDGWMEWLSAERVPVWVESTQFDPTQLFDLLHGYPDVTVVLSEVHYSDVTWALPLLGSLPNIHVEVSRFVIADGITRLLDIAGYDRVLFGSRFPESPMAPQLYNLHMCDLSELELMAICAGNLDRLLGES